MNLNDQLFFPVQSRRTFEEVSVEIKKLIFNGTLKPGDRLPTEVELAQQFKVGRQTIREAMRILELSGLIRVQKGGNGGPVIRNAVLETVNALLLDAFQLEDISIDEITQARLEIERTVLSYAISNCTDEDLTALGQNIRQAKEKISQNTSAFDDNLAFHVLLAQASKNRIFVIVARTIMAMLETLLRRLNPSLAVSRTAINAHEQILEALREKNQDEALLVLERHLQEVNDRLKCFP